MFYKYKLIYYNLYNLLVKDFMYFDINSTETEQKIGAESVEINGAGY